MRDMSGSSASGPQPSTQHDCCALLGKSQETQTGIMFDLIVQIGNLLHGITLNCCSTSKISGVCSTCQFSFFY